MLSLLSSKSQWRKDFWKSLKPCHVGTHWKALAEYFHTSTHVPGFQRFFRILALFCIGNFASSSVRVNHQLPGLNSTQIQAVRLGKLNPRLDSPTRHSGCPANLITINLFILHIETKNSPINFMFDVITAEIEIRARPVVIHTLFCLRASYIHEQLAQFYNYLYRQTG